MKYLPVRTSLAAILGFCLIGAPAGAVEKMVDCDKGQTIQGALDSMPAAAHGQGYVVNFIGTCNEQVTVRVNRVTIDGQGDGTIFGSVRVFGAKGVWLQDLTISGPNYGVIFSAASGVISDATISYNQGHGIYVKRDGAVWVRNSTVSNNTWSGAALEQSTLEVRNSTFEKNEQDGIYARVGSRVILRDTRLIGNHGVGLSLTLHSVADLRDGTRITDHNWVGAFVRLDSALLLSGSNGVDLANPAVYCEDTESSFHNEHGTPTGDIYCSSFHW